MGRIAVAQKGITLDIRAVIIVAATKRSEVKLMANLVAEMTVKIHPEMTEAGKDLLRQMVREEVEAYMRNLFRTQRMAYSDVQVARLPLISGATGGEIDGNQ